MNETQLFKKRLKGRLQVTFWTSFTEVKVQILADFPKSFPISTNNHHFNDNHLLSSASLEIHRGNLTHPKDVISDLFGALPQPVGKCLKWSQYRGISIRGKIGLILGPWMPEVNDAPPFSLTQVKCENRIINCVA